MLTVVMYHYVRELDGSSYPALKALTTAEFDRQLDFIEQHHTVIGWPELLAAVSGEAPLPMDACLLTFDDGLRDHYVNVIPRLARRNWTGCFFPSSAPVLDHVVLMVHKLHFVLAAAADTASVVGRVAEELGRLREEDPALPTWLQLRDMHPIESRFDDPEIALVKHALQTVLPLHTRRAIVDALFEDLVTQDEAAFSTDLYMSASELIELTEAGMTIGGHGHTHERLALLSGEQQEAEVEGMLRLLKMVRSGPVAPWCLAYPHGSYNEVTLRLVRRYGAAIGFTIEVGRVSALDTPLELERLDTNDLPPKSLPSS
jgi:peptidoglycan/xylan/chitin deacetylase (PgdA/CDA1 family)